MKLDWFHSWWLYLRDYNQSSTFYLLKYLLRVNTAHTSLYFTCHKVITAPTKVVSAWYSLNFTLGGYIWQIIAHSVLFTSRNTFKGPINLLKGYISPDGITTKSEIKSIWCRNNLSVTRLALYSLFGRWNTALYELYWPFKGISTGKKDWIVYNLSNITTKSEIMSIWCRNKLSVTRLGLRVTVTAKLHNLS